MAITIREVSNVQGRQMREGTFIHHMVLEVRVFVVATVPKPATEVHPLLMVLKPKEVLEASGNAHNCGFLSEWLGFKGQPRELWFQDLDSRLPIS